MSLDLAVLSQDSAPDYESALSVYAEESPGVADEKALGNFLAEVNVLYRDAWPWTGAPIETAACVYFQVAPESWGEVVPTLVEVAHRHGLVALDPQAEELFPPGVPYELDTDEEVDIERARRIVARSRARMRAGLAPDDWDGRLPEPPIR